MVMKSANLAFLVFGTAIKRIFLSKDKKIWVISGLDMQFDIVYGKYWL